MEGIGDEDTPLLSSKSSRRRVEESRTPILVSKSRVNAVGGRAVPVVEIEGIRSEGGNCPVVEIKRKEAAVSPSWCQNELNGCLSFCR
jgi:hypothetical protein